MCCAAVLLALAGCSGGSQSTAKKFDNSAVTAMPEDNLIAENEKLRLEFDRETAGVILTDLATGMRWSTTPEDSGEPEYDELGMPVSKHPRVKSVLAVKYLDYETNTEIDILSYNGAVENGRVRCALGKNSLLAEFYFDEAGFMIPVEFILNEDSLQIRIDPSKIQESENQIVEISIAPFFCSAENDSQDTYVFVPSGSGAIIDARERSQQGVTYSSQVYGYDYSIKRDTIVSNTASVRLPVYGVRSAEGQGMLAIIDSSADSAVIEAVAGSTAMGYTSVYGKFQMRGYTNHEAVIFSWDKIEKLVYSERMIDTPVSVSFYPLTGGSANYTGMAEKYRDYLVKSGKLSEGGEEKLLNLTFAGGTLITKSFLGIPYSSMFAATTLEEVGEILEDISDKTVCGINVKLKGYGTSGTDVGKIAGGYKIDGSLGSKKELESLNAFCGENGISLYMDFELTRFSSSGGGASSFFDAAYDSGRQRVLQYSYDIAVRDTVEDTQYYLLSPSKITGIADKLIKKTSGFAIDGISLESLSSVSYSDYSDKSNSAYYSKSGFGDIVTSVLEKIGEAGKKVMVSDANAYAAVNADVIFDAPLVSDKNTIFSADVPFYAMVFKGYVPMASTSLNLSSDREQLLLRAVEAGCGLQYTVTADWDNSLIGKEYPLFYNSVYENISDTLAAEVSDMAEYFEMISGAKIASHNILENGLRETVFDNGVRVYVNYSGNTLDSPAGDVAPLDYSVMEKS